jgi:hypothetical protein
MSDLTSSALPRLREHLRRWPEVFARAADAKPRLDRFRQAFKSLEADCKMSPTNAEHWRRRVEAMAQDAQDDVAAWERYAHLVEAIRRDTSAVVAAARAAGQDETSLVMFAADLDGNYHQAAREVVERLAASDVPLEQGKRKKSPRKRVSVAEADAAMKAALQEVEHDADLSRLTWTVRQWARYVVCSLDTISRCPTWRRLQETRERKTDAKRRQRRDRRRG